MLVISLFFLYINNVDAEVIFSEIQSPSVLIEEIKGGNHIIYMRHGTSLKSYAGLDVDIFDLRRCETQRNLSKSGKFQVKNLAITIKSLNIPIGQVKSSPYCRAIDTAREVFGEFEVDEKLKLSLPLRTDDTELAAQYLLNSMLASNDAEKNTVFVGHLSNLKDAADVWLDPEGSMAVFKKEGDDILFKGIIKPSDWPKL